MKTAIGAYTPILVWSDLMWMYYEHAASVGIYVGEAGNSRWGDKFQNSAVRKGDEVTIMAPSHYDPDCRQLKISASTVLRGFAPELENRPLFEIMVEGEVYDFSFNQIKQS